MSKARRFYPGNERHQALLRAIVSCSEGDPRVLAVAVFGSLGRGDWDAWSDVDLDVILADGVEADVEAEVRRLGKSFDRIGERVALVVPDGDDAVDVVLESLLLLSVRYHVLAQTKPAILDSMLLLCGCLGEATIRTAGLANSRPAETAGRLLDTFIRYAVVADTCLHRGRVWETVELLQRMRTLLMQLFADTHGGGRGWLAFEQRASPELRARVGATLPQADADSLHTCLLRLIELLEVDLDTLTDGQVELSAAQRRVLQRVRGSLAAEG